MLPTMQNGKWGYPIQQIPEHILQRKAELGSNVHQAISDHIKNEFSVITDKEDLYLESFLKWEKAVNLETRDAEMRLYYEPMKLTGCIDMIGKVQSNGPYHLIDFKCTATHDPVKWPLQAAFYSFLAQVNGMKLDNRCLFIQLDPNGNLPKVHEYEITKELTATAISLYNVYVHLTSN